MMVVLMLIGVLICNQGAVVSYKTFSTVSDGNQRVAPIFMAFWTGMLGSLITITSVIINRSYNPSMVTLIAALVGGLGFAAAGILSIKVMATGPFIWSVLMMSLASFLPVLYAPVFLGELISLPQIVGVLLILTILLIMNIKQKDDSRPFTPQWMVLAVIGMLVNGSVLCAQKTQSHFTNGGELLELLSLMFLSASFFAGMYFLLTPGTKKKIPFRTFLSPAFGLVGSIGFYNVFSMTLMGQISAAVQFPIIVGGGIVLSACISVLLYKEHTGWRLYLSAILLTAGVILLGY